MRSKIIGTGLFVALSMISTLSFAECGMDRKLEIIEEMIDIREERQMIIDAHRVDKKAEHILRMLDIRERELKYEYEVVCNA